MKNLICINIFIFLSIYIYAQVPQGINYQAIARSSIGDPIKDQPVTVKFRILEGGPNGTQVFTEIHPQ
ncbi:MAG TPA: hypothetical protein VK590_11650, partial [Saprospiraceae bacterium]|nr:hypothetical protein [Saprospiraceae bacterium]